MRKKIITMLLVAVTLTTVIPTNSYATVTIDKTTQDEAFMRSEVTINTESLSEDSLYLVISKDDIAKAVKRKNKHCSIYSSDSSLVKAELPVNAFKSKDSMRVYILDSEGYHITNKKVKYDTDDNLVIKLPKLEEGSYYFTDKKNQKEIDDKIFESMSYSMTMKKNQTINLKTENVKSIHIKSDNKKAVSVKGSKITCHGGGSANITMKIVLKDGGTKTIKKSVNLN